MLCISVLRDKDVNSMLAELPAQGLTAASAALGPKARLLGAARSTVADRPNLNGAIVPSAIVRFCGAGR